ncbi:hypothetical protein G6F38_013842 [Rhizopus arrhizus]|nr:hypothetical protein G6F38_013842 [Rhizopus arrhizus]
MTGGLWCLMMRLKSTFSDQTVAIKGGQGSVMVWGSITYDGPGYACWIHDGTMKAVDYVNILETTLMDSLKYYGCNPKDIYFQQDKDPKHISKLAKQ